MNPFIRRTNALVACLALAGLGVALAGCQSLPTASAPGFADVLADAGTEGAASETLEGAAGTEPTETAVAAVTPVKRPPEDVPSAAVADAGAEPAEDTTVTSLAPVQTRAAKPNPFQSFVQQSNETRKRQAESRKQRADLARQKRESVAAAQLAQDQSAKAEPTKGNQVVALVNTSTGTVRTSSSGSDSALPGVDTDTLFGIESEEAEEESDLGSEPQRVASVTNLARRGTHGLLLQHSGVQVGCFGPELLGIIRNVERKFGRTPVITSGYRNPRHNRRVSGAKRSAHLSCKAADLQVKGVSKFTLAKYLRSLPGRGGVGTYCHIEPVHVDVGPKRSWHTCPRSRKKRKS